MSRKNNKSENKLLCFGTVLLLYDTYPQELVVHDHVDRWAKNKRMFRFPDTWFIFNLYRRKIPFFYIYQIHTHITCYNIQGMHELIICKGIILLE
jgi:hypothetical protein